MNRTAPVPLRLPDFDFSVPIRWPAEGEQDYAVRLLHFLDNKVRCNRHELDLSHHDLSEARFDAAFQPIILLVLQGALAGLPQLLLLLWPSSVACGPARWMGLTCFLPVLGGAFALRWLPRLLRAIRRRWRKPS